jgi:predicted transcriptional regulator
MSDESGPARDAEAVRRFIERFTPMLEEAGFPRMPARIFAALLTADSTLTAAELGALLKASAGAVSGGVRYLVQVGPIRREGEPGSRRHFYRVPDDVWPELLQLRNRILQRWAGTLREGTELFGADTPAGARMAGSARYFEFVNSSMPSLLASWQEVAAGQPPRLKSVRSD